MNKCWISQLLINQIIEEIEKWDPLETGGVLMGYIASNNDVVVTELIACGSNATHRRYSFEPEQEFQLEEIAGIHASTDGKTTYLGDWHSHPKSSPGLSFIDKRTLTNIALTKESQCPFPVMMIAGSKPKKWDFNTVRFVSGRKVLWPMTKCELESLELKID